MRLICPLHAVEDCLERETLEDGRTRVICHESHLTVREDPLPEEKGSSTGESTAPRLTSPAAPEPETWEGVAEWNRALEQTIFDGRYAGRPVYLDLNAEELAAAAKCLPGTPDDPETDLVTKVSAVLALDRRRWLRPAVRRLERWEQSPDEGGAPPILAVLAVLVLAAEHMHADEDMSSRNYYGRLTRDVLGLDESQRDAIAHGYRKDSPRLFRALNDWLAAEDGARGLPTARAGGQTNKYVNYAVSQALLRDGDRQRLARFFSYYGLTPGTAVAIEDMARLLKEHASRSVSTLGHNLTRLVSSTRETRLRLAALVAEELEDWDGSVPSRDRRSQTASDVTDLRVAATIGGFPRPSLRLGLLHSRDDSDKHWRCRDDVAQVLGAASGPLRPLADGWFLLEIDGQPAWSAVLARGIELDVGGAATARQPRRVIILRYEATLSQWVEVDRVAAGEDAVVLSVSAAQDDVSRALEDGARPGWEQHADFAGLPEGWVLFTNVQIMGSPERVSSDLTGLVPSSHASLTLGGGLRLPEQPRRWHRQAPPEIRLSLAGHDSVWVHLRHARAIGGGEPRAAIRLGPHPGMAALSLGDFDLPAGDYVVAVTSSSDLDDKSMIIQGTMRLRDGDHLAASRIGKDPLRLGHWSESSTSGLWASESGMGQTALEGARALSDGGLPEPITEGQADMPVVPSWVVARRLPSTADVAEAPVSVEPPHCFVDGAHRFNLDEATRGGGMLDAACTECGKRQFFPTRPVRKGQWDDRRRQFLDQMTRSAKVETVDDVADVDLSADVVLDALTHLRDGSGAQLKTVLRAGLDALAAAVLARNLEALGHLEIERDDTFQAVRWRAAPATLALLPSGASDRPTAVLAGERSASLLQALEDACELVGTQVRADEQPGPAPRRLSVEATEADLEEIAALVRGEGHDLRVSAQAAETAASLIQPVRVLVDWLPRRTPPHRAAVRRLDLRELTWKTAHLMGVPGVYRVDLGFRSFQCLRTQEDIAQGIIRTGPQELIKHAAPVVFRRDLYVAYSDDQLIAPSRVGLPGLLERAAVLSSGYVAEERTNGQRVYRQIPSHVARRIIERLSW